MNLQLLFEAQRVLDERIIKEKGLQGQDLLPSLILALQVELGELANEWRGFKHWSNRQLPTEPDYNWQPNEDGSELIWKPEFGYKSHPLLEEYVDCLHFVLSICNENFEWGGEDFRVGIPSDLSAIKENELITQFNCSFTDLGLFYDASCFRVLEKVSATWDHWENFVRTFIGLGEILGFTWEQIEAAYFEKNQVNHQRQESGY